MERDWEKIARTLAENICRVKRQCEKGRADNYRMRVEKGYDLSSDIMMECEEIEDHVAEVTDEVYSDTITLITGGKKCIDGKQIQ